MTKILFVVLIGLLFSVATGEIDISGFIKTDLRIQARDPFAFSFNRNIFNVGIKSRDADKVGFCGELEFVAQGFNNISSFDDLKDIDKVTDLWIDVRNAYVDFYGFLFPQLDLRVGSQIEVWGTADQINPTDYLNPYDFSDPFDFGRKLSNTMLKTSVYISAFTFTGALVPIFKPTRLPDDDALFGSSMDEMLPPGMTLHSLSQNIIMPEKNARNMSGAFKVGVNAFDYDFSLSYFYGRDHLPLPTAISMTPVSPTALDMTVTMQYPQIQVVGLDFAGAIKDVGIWGEGAIVIPEKVETDITMPTPQGTMTITETTLDNEPFLKGVLGLDYTFKGGVYVQTQYIHGFIGEIGKDNLGDYIMIALEKSFINDELTIRLAGGIEIQNRDKISFIPLPELSYKPGYGFELALGAYIIEGDKETTFGKWDDKDEVYLKIKKSF